MPVSQKLACTVDRIVAHGDGVYTVTLRPERLVPRFRAGQFLHLALDAYDPTGFWPESRVFSIASSPAARETVRITYSVHGRYTQRMEQELGEGRRVWIKMPYGEFVIDATREAALFAGGTGMTAFTAFVDGLSAGNGVPVTLAYGARTEPLLIYRHLVEESVARSASLNALYFVEQPSHAASVHPGRVSVDAVWPKLSGPFEAQYYISGPPPMLRGIRSDLQSRGIAPEAIHIDAWE